MYRDAKLLHVFLASPGDLTEERRIAKEVVDEINLSIGRRIDWRVELLGWEDTTPTYARPQSKINEDVDRCELFVGLVWRRWGHPPGDSKFASGFEEEFERARARRAKDNNPEIWVFFRSIGEDHLADPGEQLKYVLAFRAKLQTDQFLMYKDFISPIDWEKQFRIALTDYLLILSKHHSTIDTTASPTTSPTSFDTTLALPADISPTNGLEKDAMQCLHRLSDAIAAGALNVGHISGLNNSDLARASVLVSTLFSTSYSDELLGVHLGNFIFRSKGTITLALKERLFIFRSSVGAYPNYIPGWFWIKGYPRPSNTITNLATYDSSDSVRLGAITLIRDLSLAIKDKSRRALLRSVLDHGTDQIKRRTLMWLQDRGQGNDQWFIDEIARDTGFRFTNELERTRIKILAREDETAAFEYIINRDKEVDNSILEEVAHSIDWRLLEGALTHKNAGARKFAGLALARQNRLSKQAALGLVVDPVQSVREIGVRATVSLGHYLDEAVIREAFPKPLGLLSSTLSRIEDVKELIFDSFSKLDIGTLEQLIDWNPDGGVIAYKALVLTHWTGCGDRVRAELADEFNEIYLKWAAKRSAHIVDDYEKNGINAFIRAQFIAAALSALARFGSKDDEPLVRRYLEHKDTAVTRQVGEFLGNFGNSANAREVITIAERTWSEQLVAMACKLADEPQSFVLDDSINGKIREMVLALLNGDEIKKLKQNWNTLLTDKESSFRRRTVFKIAEYTTIKEREIILERYMSQSPYVYYDVIFWLDRLTYSPVHLHVNFRQSLDRHLKDPYLDWAF